MKYTKILLILIMIFAVLGVIDSTILIDIHINNRIGMQTPFCSVHSGCDIVDQSKYSELFHIPLGVYGLIFYLLILVGCICNVFLLSNKSKSFFARYFHFILFGFGIIGIISSAILLYTMKYLIGAYCKYCLFSELMNLLILIAAILYVIKIISKHKKSTK